MQYNLYFISGWGFDSNFWLPTKNLLLKKKYINSASILDPNFDQKYKFNSLKKKIFITHSIGLSFFFKMRTDSLALINFFSAPSFLNFQKNINKAKKTLDLMLRKFDEDPKYVLTNFFKNCGLSNYEFLKSEDNFQKLKAQLVNLRNENFTQEFENFPSKTLTLFSNSDKIFCASEKKLKSIKKQKHIIRRMHGAEHGFPLINPSETSKVIDEFLCTLT